MCMNVLQTKRMMCWVPLQDWGVLIRVCTATLKHLRLCFALCVLSAFWAMLHFQFLLRITCGLAWLCCALCCLCCLAVLMPVTLCLVGQGCLATVHVRFHTTRLETQTKESNACASLGMSLLGWVNIIVGNRAPTANWSCERGLNLSVRIRTRKMVNYAREE